MSNASNPVVTVRADDFDPIVAYENYTAWQTPDPQDHPTWYNESSSVTGVPWYEATYHNTTSKTSATYNFTSTSLTIYGDNGGGGYTVEIDGAAQALPDTPARVDNRSVLFNTTSLSNSPHVLKVSNADGWLLLDEFTTTVPVAAPGCGIVGDSSLTPSSAFDTKLADDRDPRIKFTGSWTQQTGDNFENKTSTYTSGLNNSFEFVFDGSAVWVYGDQVNDHGDYEVFINDTRVAAHTGRSGCSGSSDQRCEKLHGVKFFGGPYPYGNHTLRVANTGAATFFDLDYITWTTPHNWAAVSAAATSSQPSQPSSSTSASASKAPSKPSSAAAPFGAGDNTGILLITLAAWALGKFV